MVEKKESLEKKFKILFNSLPLPHTDITSKKLGLGIAKVYSFGELLGGYIFKVDLNAPWWKKILGHRRNYIAVVTYDRDRDKFIFAAKNREDCPLLETIGAEYERQDLNTKVIVEKP